MLIENYEPGTTARIVIRFTRGEAVAALRAAARAAGLSVPDGCSFVWYNDRPDSGSEPPERTLALVVDYVCPQSRPEGDQNANH